MTAVLATGDHCILQVLSEEAFASLLLACIREHGLLTIPPIKVKSAFSDSVHVTCVVCYGKVCKQMTVRVPFSRSIKSIAELGQHHLGLLPEPSPDRRLAMRLLMQPYALAASGGMLLLTTCVTVQSGPTDALLWLIGGRDSFVPLLLLIVGWLSHIVQALYAFVNAHYIKGCFRKGALRWAACVLVAGYPVLKFVIAFRPLPPLPKKPEKPEK